MRILFISEELGASELALKLRQEGNEVKLFIRCANLKECFDGLVEKTDDWHSELSWVGKEGLIVFDDVGYGKEQSRLRAEGYRVVGGSEEGDRMEKDRLVGKKVFEEAGLQALPAYTFSDPESAIKFIENDRENIWVVKVNGGHVSSLCYVGMRPDQKDVIAILRYYQGMGITYLNLQKKVMGVEVGVGRYFNGHDWVGPIEMNVEHKALMPRDIGPKTAEMGTLMWYDENEQNRLFTETLGRLKGYLTDIDFRGDVDINCIVQARNVWPLELTARFGNPSTALQMEMHLSPWTEFLSAIADGASYELQHKSGYGITVTVATPPFPYFMENESAETTKGLPICFLEEVSPEELKHYIFEEVRFAGTEKGLYIAGNKGCIMHVCGSGESITDARKVVYSRVSNLQIPKSFYRDDIGEEFMKSGLPQLTQWGWL